MLETNVRPHRKAFAGNHLAVTGYIVYTSASWLILPISQLVQQQK